MTQQYDAAHQAAPPDPHAQRPTVIEGVIKLVLAVVVVAAFIAISGMLGIVDMWVGFLFALYWAALQRSDFKKLPDALLGAIIGLAYACLLRDLPPLIGNAAIILSIAVVIVMVFMQIMGWFSVVINSATMLFMLVATIPSIIVNSQFPKLAISLAFGAAYFVAIIWIAKQVRKRKSDSGRIARPAHEDAQTSVLSK